MPRTDTSACARVAASRVRGRAGLSAIQPRRAPRIVWLSLISKRASIADASIPGTLGRRRPRNGCEGLILTGGNWMCPRRSSARFNRRHTCHLVIELRTRLRVSIRKVNGRDQHAVYRRFDIARLTIPSIPRQAGSRQQRVALPRQDRDPVPGTFARPDSAIAEFTKGVCRKSSLINLELLEATTSGWAFVSHAVRFCRRLLTLLMLNVAIFNGPALANWAGYDNAEQAPG
jgi:hypothetical protein